MDFLNFHIRQNVFALHGGQTNSRWKSLVLDHFGRLKSVENKGLFNQKQLLFKSSRGMCVFLFYFYTMMLWFPGWFKRLKVTERDWKQLHKLFSAMGEALFSRVWELMGLTKIMFLKIATMIASDTDEFGAAMLCRDSCTSCTSCCSYVAEYIFGFDLLRIER